jgi:cell division GTPase FtsZ
MCSLLCSVGGGLGSIALHVMTKIRSSLDRLVSQVCNTPRKDLLALEQASDRIYEAEIGAIDYQSSEDVT